METFEDRKLLHERKEKMKRYRALVEVVTSHYIVVDGAFNENYKDGKEHAERTAEDLTYDQMPSKWCKEGDVTVEGFCKELEIIGEEPEEVDDDR
jgi:hypothetical protein